MAQQSTCNRPPGFRHDAHQDRGMLESATANRHYRIGALLYCIFCWLAVALIAAVIVRLTG